MVVTARAEAGEAFCPVCGEASRRVHSRYVRHVRDLPFSGQGVRLRLATRRFSCERRDCPRRIFAERFEDGDRPQPWRRLQHRHDFIVPDIEEWIGSPSFSTRLLLAGKSGILFKPVGGGRAESSFRAGNGRRMVAAQVHE